MRGLARRYAELYVSSQAAGLNTDSCASPSGAKTLTMGALEIEFFISTARRGYDAGAPVRVRVQRGRPGSVIHIHGAPWI